jgi:spore maturation protein CgeB
MEPGTKVLVVFSPSWPLDRATYTYEGRTETGWWVRRKDGVQRHFRFEDVESVTPVSDSEDVSESPH